MFPFVNNAQIARQLVRAVKFPPLGDRGVDGAGMDADYTLAAWTPGSDYCGEANRETFILAQIESPEALENVEEIAAVEGIDCLFVGPADLTRRMSSLPGNEPFVLDDAVRRVADAASRAGKAWGSPCLLWRPCKIPRDGRPGDALGWRLFPGRGPGPMPQGPGWSPGAE